MMNTTFEIQINIMGDVSLTPVIVQFSEETKEYELSFPNQEDKIRVTFSDEGYIVQTYGIPLDSNTIYHISEELKKNKN
jgi:hypothetical protein